MQMSSRCMACLIDHQARLIAPYSDEHLKAAYLQAVLRAVSEADETVSAPLMTARIDKIHKQFFGFGEDLTELKQAYNARMLRLVPEINRKIDASPDPVYAAIQYARAGNYIDFGAMTGVDDEKLQSILDGAHKEALDAAEYAHFCEELEGAKRFLLVSDNAGEIVLDKLLVERLLKAYPNLAVTVLTRGMLTSNDATPDDARSVGLFELASVLGNGTDIAGTEMALISDEARAALRAADVILAKGQGNFETLTGCGLNVYYVFLNKCDWFVHRFGMPRYSGMFVSERRFGSHQFL